MKRYRPKIWTLHAALTYAQVQAAWNPDGAARLAAWAMRRFGAVIR